MESVVDPQTGVLSYSCSSALLLPPLYFVPLLLLLLLLLLLPLPFSPFVLLLPCHTYPAPLLMTLLLKRL